MLVKILIGATTLALAWTGAAEAQTIAPPTATEAFNLRKACVALGEKYKRSKRGASDNNDYRVVVSTNYSFREARCFVEVWKEWTEKRTPVKRDKDDTFTFDEDQIEYTELRDGQTDRILITVGRTVKANGKVDESGNGDGVKKADDYGYQSALSLIRAKMKQE